MEVLRKDIIALIFDFDDTLVPDSTTQFLKANGFDTGKFWKEEVAALVKAGYDPPAAYLTLILKNTGEGKPLGRLSNARLREFGSSLDNTFHPGLPEFFDELRAEVAKHDNIELEYYIISGGLYEIVRGSEIVRKHFKAVYGCHFAEDDGIVSHVKRSVTFTEKTRYIFEINKGLDPRETFCNPGLVNKAVPNRRIPLKNMIYVGDGLTDVPCFSLLQAFGGMGFGVFDPSDEGKAKQAFEDFLLPRRVMNIMEPNYKKGGALRAILQTAVLSICSQISLDRQQPRRET
jgi:phosphoserine phosphatase